MRPKRTATTTTPLTDAQIKALISQGVVDALAEHEANRSRNGDDSHNSGSDGRRRMLVACECTYTDFLKCQPLNFKGTEGVVGLTHWFEKMESVFHISNCIVACQIKFATCTLQGNALTWWNSHVRIVELALMCGRMFPEESDEVEKYVGGLPDMIQGTENKRKFEDTSRNNQNQQQPFKRHNVARSYTCAPKCNNYKRTGHLARDCRSQPVAANNQRASGANQRVLTCFECGAQGHFKRDCSKLKNNNRGNQAGNGGATTRAYAVGTTGTNPNSNVLSTYHVVIVCDEKIIHIPFGDEILIVRGDRSNNGHESRLNIISYTKTQKYFLKGFQVCLAHITMKKAEEKSEEKRLEDVPIVRDFPKVFLEDLTGIPPT
ncbi:putative reverse transcriptase domain-containing protein [Tanacetum coccineum]